MARGFDFRAVRRVIWVGCAVWLLAGTLDAQDRETKVRQDRTRFVDDKRWIYNDLELGIGEARKTGKPILVVFRCIPCEACSEFDKHVIGEENGIGELLDQFVCVRIVQANNLDLSLFQFDYDQSFHAVLMNADKTIYGRFGTRSSRPEEEDMTMQSLSAALKLALAWHAEFPANRDRFAAKRQVEASVRVPEEYPMLAGKYGAKLNYEGNVVQSCIHCHQVRESERMVFRDRGDKIPDQQLFPYPLPDDIGLRMNPQTATTVAAVTENSAAHKAGLRAGDEILELNGQPLLSTADIQWVLHQARDPDQLQAVVRRGSATQPVSVALPQGWREQCEISFRATTWDLRRMASGGILLEDLPDDQRRARGLSNGQLALRAKHVGQYGEHATAKNAGFVKEDLIIGVNDRKDRMTESQFLGYVLDQPKGSKLQLRVLRGQREMTMTFPTH
jgi:serine protease Do